MAWSLDSKLPAWSITTRKGKENLYVFFRKPWDKKQTSLDLGTGLYSEANTKAPKRVVDYLNENDPANSVVITSNGTETFEAFREEFLKDKHLKNKETTKSAANSVVKMFIQQIGTPYIANLTWPMFRDYIDARKQTHKIKGVFNTLINLRVFMDYLMENKVLTENFARRYPLPSTDEFDVNEITWTPEEFRVFYEASNLEDKDYLWCIWHTGMDLADLFFLRKKHIKEVGGAYVITKLREKAKTAKQVIKFPLEHCPAKDIFMAAYHKAKGPEDRLFFHDYGDKDYKQFNWSTRTRRYRLWMRIPELREIEFKTIKQMRHTFVTEAVSGKRFEEPVQQHNLELWMGWAPGSKVAAQYYTHIRAVETAVAMRPKINPQQGVVVP